MKNTLRMIGLILAVSALLFAVASVANNYLSRENQKDSDRLSHLCEKNAIVTNHLIIIEKNILSPYNTVAKLCDTVTVVNKDTATRYMAFGEHDHHMLYDNLDVQVLEQDQSFTFTLNELGTYEIHDHLHDEVQGLFTAVQR